MLGMRRFKLSEVKRAMFIVEYKTDRRSAPAEFRRRSGLMSYRRAWSALISAAVTLIVADAALAGPREVGVWFDDTGKGAVEIFQCGSKLCGRIVWLKDPLNAKGAPLTDGYNPNPKLRNRPICGLQILGGLARQPDGTWDEGWVYDPKVGKSYDAAIELAGQKTLILTGYKGLRLLSKSFTWTKAPETLPKCDGATTAAR
jgi:uncharacterized protein (DUF2147 family)